MTAPRRFGPRTIAIAAILALAGTGVEPIPVFTGEAQASKRTAPGNAAKSGTSGKGNKGTKNRGARNKSKKTAEGKVSPAAKRGNSSKKGTRMSSGKNAKSAASKAPAAPVTAAAPSQPTTKSGADKRASMTAVSGANMSQPRTTPVATPGARASLDVNTAPRSPRTKRVTKRSSSKKTRHNRKKTERLANGYVAKASVKKPRLGGQGKVTFDTAISQTMMYNPDAPPAQLRQRESGVSSVLTRRPTAQRSQGMFKRMAVKVSNAFTFTNSAGGGS